MEARLVEQSQAVLTGTEAVARVERSIAADAVARDPAVAEGLAMAGVRAASLLEGPSGGAADGVAVSEASCVHHVHAPPGHERGGAFELAASSVQQATDHCLAAHILSRRLGRAGICSLAPSLAKDLYLVSLPEPGLIAALLAADAGAPEPDASPERIVELAREILREVGDRTGRPGNLVEIQGDGAAEVVLVASGEDTVPAREAARALSEAGVAASALSVILVRPFPKAEVREALGGSRLVLVVHAPGEPSALLAQVRGLVNEKTEVHTLAATNPTQMIEAVRQQLPAGSFEEQKLAAAPEEAPTRRLVVAPEGPWGEETARRALAALGRLVALRVGRSTGRQLGATVLDWDSSEVPEAEADLLLVSYPAVLEPEGALSLIRPRSAVVLLAEAKSAQELMGLLRPETWRAFREKELRIHWVAPPIAPGQAPSDQADCAASLTLAGAALTALRQPADAAGMAEEISAGDDQASRWLREGATAVQTLDPAALDAPPAAEELSFRSEPELPRMPDPVDDPEERQRQAQWIRRFHRLGARTFDPAPRLPVRPAVLDSLAASLRETSPDPFVLFPCDDAERPIAARGLRELLDQELDAMEDAGWDPGALSGNLSALAAIAARLLAERGPATELESLLSAAGEELVSKLALPVEDRDALRGSLEELRRRLPGQGRVLGLGADTPLRLYLEVLEAVRSPLRRRFTAQLERHRERLRDLLQLDRMSSADGRTAEALTAQLGGAAGFIDLAALSRTLPSRPGPALLDEARRQRVEGALATIEGHLEQQGRLPSVVFLHPPEVDLQLAGEEREEHPDPLAAAVGYFDGTARRLTTVFRAARVAGLEADGNYRPEVHDEVLADLDWEAFSADELALVPLVAVVTTGRSLRQRGQGSLSRLLRSSRPVHVIVLDEVGAPDEAEDLSAFHLDLGYLVMAHREAFAVGSSLARPNRLTEGLVRMVRAPRPGVALMELPARELASWQVLLAEAALRGRACPYFLYDPDAGASWADRFELDGNPQPECPWPTQGISYLEQGEQKTLEASFTFADAVALEPAYLRHLRVIPRAAWDDEGQRPLAEYVEALDLEGRQPSIPYLWVVDETETLQRAVVTRDLSLACRDRLRGWRILQELGGYENSYAQRAAAEAREQVLAEAAQERAELEQAHAEELAGARGEGARESMERLAEVLMNPTALSAAAPAASVAPAAPAAAETETDAAAEPAAEELPEEEALGFDEPYITAALCTTCNECTNINPRIFQYNANKQAFIADATAGTFAELVKAAELCPARCIHPGKPRSDDSTATPELVERASKFN